MKITATWFNSASIAAMAVGCFAPVVAFISGGAPISSLELLGVVAGFVLISVALHYAARMTLRRIEE